MAGRAHGANLRSCATVMVEGWSRLPVAPGRVGECIQAFIGALA